MASYAESDREKELDSWVLSGALEVGVNGFSAKANASSTDISGPRRPDPNPPNPTDGNISIIDPVFDRSDVTAALVGGNIELMTPGFENRYIPRAFIDLSVLAAIGAETSIARDGKPGEFVYPELTQFATIGENLILGAGTNVTAQQQAPVVHAGLGAAWTIDVRDARIRIKPSLVYTRMRIDISALSQRAVRLNTPTNGLEDYRLLSFKDQETEVYHGIGPALEVEYDTDNRFGPFLVSLFMKGHATRLFGDLETNMVRANPEYPDEQVRWNYEQDRWAYRFTSGIRFRFVPKD